MDAAIKTARKRLPWPFPVPPRRRPFLHLPLLRDLVEVSQMRCHGAKRLIVFSEFLVLSVWTS